MRQWHKEIDSDSRKQYDFLIASFILTFVVAVYTDRTILLIPSGLMLTLFIASKAYDRWSGGKLHLVNRRQSIRMFPNDQGNIYFKLQNYSKAPVINGKLQFVTGSTVVSEAYPYRDTPAGYKYSLPLSLMRKGETTVQLPVVAKQRGVARISDITFFFPHLIKFNPNMMKYLPDFETELIVYPELKSVKGIEAIFEIAQGSHAALLSPYEDVLTPLGTREYVSSDPFHRIHWKASAKTQQLRTKVLEKQVDISWSIVVNISEETKLGNVHISKQLENLLSYAAFLSQYAVRKGYQADMYINGRKQQNPPYYYQEEGIGNQHLRESLETLARIRKDQFILPLDELVHRMEAQLYKRKTIIIIGEIPNGARKQLEIWQARGIRLFQVMEEQGQAVAVPLEKRRAVHA
ncbi:DUF58 domain-containing protein [Halobacillus amylolyticus]|uniref:DUF58 domain-containing protein n=1 Tax=Halobacillus amylolyticus TaxID=2932259 RepID=A0ABY4HA91_9BACI|nr:DUF58 domain-containing protein [Halobacillus amylolyticus]UOR11783.1 DUF58 domain-containing protein [Halobacillus amylolyticus]